MEIFKKSKELHPCHLNQEDLDDLFNIMLENVHPNQSYVYIETGAKNKEFEFEESDSFLEWFSKENAPSTLKKISIHIGGRLERPGKKNKHIYVNFTKNHGYLSVSGKSESWVRGKFDQILSYLSKKKPVTWFFRSVYTYALVGGGLGLSLYYISSLTEITSGSTSKLIPVSILLAIIFSGLIAFIESHDFFRLQKKNEIWLVSFARNNYKPISILISIGILIVSLVSWLGG